MKTMMENGNLFQMNLKETETFSSQLPYIDFITVCRYNMVFVINSSR